VRLILLVLLLVGGCDEICHAQEPQYCPQCKTYHATGQPQQQAQSRFVQPGQTPRAGQYWTPPNYRSPTVYPYARRPAPRWGFGLGFGMWSGWGNRGYRGPGPGYVRLPPLVQYREVPVPRVQYQMETQPYLVRP
jgi:hypothetical protein